MQETIDHNREDYSTFIEDIENDIYYDIDNLLSENNRLYTKDRFKQNGQFIDIISPVYAYQRTGNSIKGSDSYRYLLSLYPDKKDLRKIKCIVTKPRYIEINGVELIALYIRKEKILVIYLHQPFLYPANDLKFFGLPEKLFTGISDVSRDAFLLKRDEKQNLLKIPELWYILATISCSNDDKIEKFVIKRKDKSYNDNIRKLTDIAYNYSQLGY